jgi:hypothetical protein
MKKTITIDAKQYKAAFKAIYGSGRSRGKWELEYRSGLRAANEIVECLSTGWTFDGQWKAPEKKPITRKGADEPV